MIHVKAFGKSKTATLIQFTNSLGVGAVFNSQSMPLGKDFHYASEALIRNKVIKSNVVVNKNGKRATSNYKVISLATCGTASDSRRNERMFKLPEVDLTGWAKELFMYAHPVSKGVGRVYGDV